MEKKYQIFISSTYKDLIKERQAAVEAILQAGHIPAGMELFAAGDESQINVIKRWIDESDIYILILGKRYGSIDPISNKSYIEIEFDYALSKSKPLFSVVIDTNKMKNKSNSSEITSQNYIDFRTKVTNNICRFFTDTKDIKLSILESIREIEKRKNLIGWVSGKLLEEYNTLEIKSNLTNSIKQSLSDESLNLYNGIEFLELKRILESIYIDVPGKLAYKKSGQTVNLLEAMLDLEVELDSGISQNDNSSNWYWFQYQVATKLKTFGLTVKDFYLTKLSDSGKRFIIQLRRASA